jgi:hypothetical protein
MGEEGTGRHGCEGEGSREEGKAGREREEGRGESC